MSSKVNHASYHHEVCPLCGDPWCHGCPSDEEFEAEKDMQALESQMWEKYQNGRDKPGEDEPCTGCANGCDQCLDPLMAGYEGCYHKDGESCDCAEQYRKHQMWTYSGNDNDVCTCSNCQREQTIEPVEDECDHTCNCICPLCLG